jgi:hypothetical protein
MLSSDSTQCFDFLFDPQHPYAIFGNDIEIKHSTYSKLCKERYTQMYAPIVRTEINRRTGEVRVISETGKELFRQQLTKKQMAFLGIDPKTEEFAWVSPYIYCISNPVKYVDPDGCASAYAPNGKYLGCDNQCNSSKYIMSKQQYKEYQNMNPNGGSFENSNAIKLPSDWALQEAKNILQEAKKNKLFEICSLVMKDGYILHGSQGTPMSKGVIPTSSLPKYDGNLSDVEASIHSHPVGIVENTYSNADCMGPNDAEIFSQFDYNIIAGKGNGIVRYTNDEISGSVNLYDTREFGISIYGKETKINDKPKIWLSEKSLKRILK